MSETDKIFDKADTNHNGTLSIKEIASYLEKYTGFDKHGIEWVVDHAKKDEGKDKQLDKKEFNELAN